MLTKRWGTEHESMVPYKAFKTLDGFLTLGTGNDLQFKSFCDRVSTPELAIDERFVNNACRVKNREQLYSIIEPILETKTNEEWMTIFEGVPFPYGPVNDMAQVRTYITTGTSGKHLKNNSVSFTLKISFGE